LLASFSSILSGGTITYAEFHRILADCGLLLNPDDALHVLERIDTDKSGNISYQEFIKFLTGEAASGNDKVRKKQKTNGRRRIMNTLFADVFCEAS
jgi:Ca2+-binding EF-hand superfamily protein